MSESGIWPTNYSPSFRSWRYKSEFMSEESKKATEEKVEEKAAEKKAPAKKTTAKAKTETAEKKPAAKKAPAKKAAPKADKAETPAKEEPKTEEAPVAEKVEVEEVVAAEEAKAPKPEVKVSEPVDYSKVKPLDEFDWDSYADSDELYTKEEKAQLENVYKETLTSISDNEVLDGVVSSITKKEVVVNIGYKSDGVITANEFRYNQDLKIGDNVEVYVEKTEDKTGQLVLSHKKARTTRAWEHVNSALDTQEIVTGFIKCRTKGGLIADVFGIEAFLPGSQIDVKPIRDYDQYVGKEMDFRVVKINQEFRNVVVSHKALIEAELEEQKVVIMSKLEKGQVLEGVVKNITSYGVFIDLGGVDGLVHITDLSWGRVGHPEEIVTLDEKINVVILDYTDDRHWNYFSVSSSIEKLVFQWVVISHHLDCRLIDDYTCGVRRMVWRVKPSCYQFQIHQLTIAKTHVVLHEQIGRFRIVFRSKGIVGILLARYRHRVSDCFDVWVFENIAFESLQIGFQHIASSYNQYLFFVKP